MAIAPDPVPNSRTRFQRNFSGCFWMYSMNISVKALFGGNKPPSTLIDRPSDGTQMLVSRASESSAAAGVGTLSPCDGSFSSLPSMGAVGTYAGCRRGQYFWLVLAQNPIAVTMTATTPATAAVFEAPVSHK